MDAAEFIDRVLTPIGVGVGGYIGARIAMKRRPEMKGWHPWFVGLAAGGAFAALKWSNVI